MGVLSYVLFSDPHCRGLDLYLSKFPKGNAYTFNVNHNPLQRGKKAYSIVFTLTAASHVWLVKPGRYLSGIEVVFNTQCPHQQGRNENDENISHGIPPNVLGQVIQCRVRM